MKFKPIDFIFPENMRLFCKFVMTCKSDNTAIKISIMNIFAKDIASFAEEWGTLPISLNSDNKVLLFDEFIKKYNLVI